MTRSQAPADPPPPRVLALDTASPVVSLALASEERVLAVRSVEISRSSRRLLGLLDEVLAEAGVRFAEVTGIVALRGPGSFTGLRVGLATVQGLHQARGTPATAVPTLDTLAAAASLAGVEGTILAAVDVLRREWVAQPFAAGLPARALAEPQRLAAERLPEQIPRVEAPGAARATVVGFGLDPLRETLADARLAWLDAPPLAPAAALAAARHPPEWRPELLTDPLYFRSPAVTLPKPRRRAGAARP